MVDSFDRNGRKKKLNFSFINRKKRSPLFSNFLSFFLGIFLVLGGMFSPFFSLYSSPYPSDFFSKDDLPVEKESFSFYEEDENKKDEYNENSIFLITELYCFEGSEEKVLLSLENRETHEANFYFLLLRESEKELLFQNASFSSDLNPFIEKRFSLSALSDPDEKMALMVSSEIEESSKLHRATHIAIDIDEEKTLFLQEVSEDELEEILHFIENEQRQSFPSDLKRDTPPLRNDSNEETLLTPSLAPQKGSSPSDSSWNLVGRHMFSLASYLTDAPCKSHEYFTRMQMPFHPGAYGQSSHFSIEIAKRIYYGTAFIPLAVISIPSGNAGLGARYVAISCMEDDFLSLKGEVVPKSCLKNGGFSLLSWNINAIGGGYSFTKGGVRPWKDRIASIIELIRSEDPDIICLLEVYDLKAAYTLYNTFKKDYDEKSGYYQFYFNVGPQTAGASSAIFIASKFAIRDPAFIPFAKETLLDEGKHVKKGVFAFSLLSQKEDTKSDPTFQDSTLGKTTEEVRIYATHLQHSQVDELSFQEEMVSISGPTEEEISAREKELQMILMMMKKDRLAYGKIPMLLTGDLNIGPREFGSSFIMQNYFVHAYSKPFPSTCVRDGFIQHLWEKNDNPISETTLDYTLLLHAIPIDDGCKIPYEEMDPIDQMWEIETTVGKGYDISKPDGALSDHQPLFSTIKRKNLFP